jgi:hypothetical protein
MPNATSNKVVSAFSNRIRKSVVIRAIHTASNKANTLEL